MPSHPFSPSRAIIASVDMLTYFKRSQPRFVEKLVESGEEAQEIRRGNKSELSRMEESLGRENPAKYETPLSRCRVLIFFSHGHRNITIGQKIGLPALLCWIVFLIV